MRFAVSLLAFRPGQVGGAETYVRELLARLPAVAGEDRLAVVMDRDLAAALETPGFERVVVNRSARRIVAERILEAYTPWRARAVERVLEGVRADAVLFPQQSIFPKRARVRAVLTVHDLQHLFHPENFNLFDRTFRPAIYPYSMDRAERLIAISGFTRRTLLERCGVPAEKVAVVPHGLSERDVSGVTAHAGIGAPYLYYPAATYPHKNHETLLRSYADLRKRGSIDQKLVLTGQRTAHWRRLERLAGELGIARDVVHLGHLPYAEVLQLYRGAEAVLFPSTFEGFGLPVLEAARFEKRLVTSRLDAFDEVGVPRQCQIDFADPDALLAALRLPAPTVLERQPGTWHEAAAATIEVLRQVARGSARPAGEAPAHARGPRKVLYLEHSPALGGSCVSLLQLLRGLDPARYRPVVALARPTAELARFYGEAGVPVIDWPGISTLEHTTAFWSELRRPVTWPPLAAALLRWRHSGRRTLELVERERPDLVHLNSVVLLPSADALRRAGVPFVWHVRESPAPGGARWRRLQREALGRWPAEAFFLTAGEREAWTDGEAAGRVLPEPVDTERFAPSRDGGPVRRALGIPADAKVVLYSGGLAAIKGILPLLAALARVREREPRVLCLMPGSAPGDGPDGPSSRASPGLLPRAWLPRRVERSIAELGLERVCRRTGFSDDMPGMIAASDLVVFPATHDHFARPLVEAAAMAKPVVASRLPTLEEQVRAGETGLLVPAGDPAALAEAILTVLADPDRASAMGQAGRRLALERHDARRVAEEVMEAYDHALGAAPAGPGSTR
jgi:glycosyltransferase involved in cell wall biosynthesis